MKQINKLELTIVGTRYNMPGESKDEKTTAAEAFLSSLPAGARFILSKCPDNPYNPEAIASIYEADYNHYGYVSDEQLYLITPFLDEFGQCDATLTQTDGHITYTVEVNVPEGEIPAFNPHTDRVLTDCPLPHILMLEVLPAEHRMRVFPMRLVKIEIGHETLPDLYRQTQMLLDCFNSSLCRDDAHWQREVQKKINQVHTFVKKHYSKEVPTECQSPKAWYKLVDRCRDLLGDYHRCEGHGTIIEEQFSHLVNDPKAGVTVQRFIDHYQQEATSQLQKMHDWFKENLNMVYTEHLDWKELGHTVTYMKMSRAETYEILTVLVLLHKLYRTAVARPSAIAKPQKSDKPKPTAAAADTPPRRHGDNHPVFSTCRGFDHNYITFLREKLVKANWIGANTSAHEFQSLFSGGTNDCEILWTGEVGKGTLKYLFDRLVAEQFITTPESIGVVPILEAHFVDAEHNFITGLHHGKVAKTEKPFIEDDIIRTLHIRPTDQSLREAFDNIVNDPRDSY